MTAAPEPVSAAAGSGHGAVAAAWARGLPALVSTYADAWQLTVGAPFDGLSYAWAAPVVRSDGSEAVLKLAVPGDAVDTEAATLRAYGGRGAVRLLAADVAGGALLLERARPGTTLRAALRAGDLDDESATSVLCDLLVRLPRAVPADAVFPSVRDWGAALQRACDIRDPRLPQTLVRRAASLYRDLVASSGPPVLLHADLHHDNVLRHGDGWVAIDPHGVVGELAYDAASMLRNPMPELLSGDDVSAVLDRRIAVLAERLGVERGRLRAWGHAYAVLSACWFAEDNWLAEDRVARDGIAYQLTCARLLL